MGMLCKHCSSKKCVDSGTEAEPIEIECVVCSGAGCEKCNHGMIGVVGCPMTECADVAYAVHLCDLFEKGLPPIAGGALDQTVWFLEAARILKNDEAEIKAERYGI